MPEFEFPVALPRDRIIFASPEWLVPETPAWIGHIPFAFWVVSAVHPSTIVELGTHYGNSYFAMAQAVRSNDLPAEMYAVDTWRGDEHSGEYGEDVFEAVFEHNDANYAGFSTLVRSTFDDAARHFDSGSIDLLHIDGHHTYDSVRHDFDLWRPLLSDRAVVLLHDVKVRERGFGVHRLMTELAELHPTFAFTHSHGLGVIGVGTEQSETMQALFATSGEPRATADVRDIFSTLGRGIVASATVDHAMAEVKDEMEERISDTVLEAKEEANAALDAIREDYEQRLVDAEERHAEELAGQRIAFERRIASAEERAALADQRAAARFSERLSEIVRDGGHRT